jgi:hypothetical protein
MAEVLNQAGWHMILMGMMMVTGLCVDVRAHGL